LSIVALHPEELLERDATGELSSAEQARLALHLEHCAVCRLERTLRADFRREEEPLGPDFDVHSLLSGVLAPGAASPLGSIPTLAAPQAAPGVLRPRRASTMRQVRLGLLVAAALFVAGAAVAEGWQSIARHARDESQEAIWSQAARRARAAPSIANANGGPNRRLNASVPPRDVAGSLGLPFSVDPTPSLSAAPSAVSPVKPTQVRTPAHVSSVSSHASSVAASSSPLAQPAAFGLKPSSAAASAPSDAATLFAQANAVRRSGDHAGAADLYRTLVESYPRSAEAHEAEAALGHLLLEDGNASAALHHFDEYLSYGGPLEEDVRVDRALAFYRLHRASEEADAWASLLRAHPGSVHADRARARLRELGDR